MQHGRQIPGFRAERSKLDEWENAIPDQASKLARRPAFRARDRLDLIRLCFDQV